MDFLISHAYRTTGLVNTDDDLSMDSRAAQLPPKKGGKRWALTAIRGSKEARYTWGSNTISSLPIAIDLVP